MFATVSSVLWKQKINEMCNMKITDFNGVFAVLLAFKSVNKCGSLIKTEGLHCQLPVFGNITVFDVML